jgi:Copper transport outer membrane protein, MctB
VIDFRYHLVSIVAVFLALAIGIVVGATALKPSTLKYLDKTSQQERQEINSLLANKGNLQQQLTNNNAFAEANAGLILDHLLEGKRTVIVTAPGADGQVVNGVTTALSQAGAQVTGQVALQQSFFVAGQSTQGNLVALAQQLVPPGISLIGPGTQSGAGPQIAGQQEAAQVIAAALVTKDGPGLDAAKSRQILSGFAQHGFLDVSTPTLAPATLAVVVIPSSPPAGGASDPANLALLALAEQLDTNGQAAVLAGSVPGSGPGSAIDEVSGGGSSGIPLSSVDNANTEIGQIMVAQALNLLLTGHKPASYGVVPAAVPTPAPTPAPSASLSGAAAGQAAGRARQR